MVNIMCVKHNYQRIIQDHGGAITVDSHLTRGTTFTVRLPLNGERA